MNIFADSAAGRKTLSKKIFAQADDVLKKIIQFWKYDFRGGALKYYTIFPSSI